MYKIVNDYYEGGNSGYGMKFKWPRIRIIIIIIIRFGRFNLQISNNNGGYYSIPFVSKNYKENYYNDNSYSQLSEDVEEQDDMEWRTLVPYKFQWLSKNGVVQGLLFCTALPMLYIYV